MTSLRRHLEQCTLGVLTDGHAQFVRRGGALHLNETRPLLAAFEFRALTPREIHYAAVDYGVNSLRIQTKAE